MWRRFLSSFFGDPSDPSNSSNPAAPSNPSFPLPTASRSLPPTRGKRMSNTFKPTVADVLLVKSLIAYQARRTPLPIELIEQIIDDAEYWPCVRGSLAEPVAATGGYNFSGREDVFLFRTPPVCSTATAFNDLSGGLSSAETWKTEPPLPEPELVHPVRKIVFTLHSHDQGWSGENQETHGTYHPTYSWFSVGLERPVVKQEEREKNIDIDELHFSPNDLLKAWPGPNLHKKEEDVQPAADTDTDSNVTENTDEETEPEKPEAEVLKTPIPKWKMGKTPLPPDDSDDPQPSTSSSPPSNPQPEPKIEFEPLTAPYIDETASHWGSPLRLQSNRQSRRATQEHVITWRRTDNTDPDSPEGNGLEMQGRGRRTANGEFVRQMRRGDVVTLRAHARFPGWRNEVEGAECEVYFAV